MTENTQQTATNGSSKIIQSLKRNQGFLIASLVFLILPFIINLFTGSGLNDGLTKYWQGQLIPFFIFAVYAMSYDLLMGYAGILSFGHAAFFGAGAYSVALILEHLGPSIMEKYRIVGLGGGDITEIVIFIAAFLTAIVVSALLGLLFSATSVRLKGAYFAMLTLALAEAIHILSKATDFTQWTGADEGLHGVAVPKWINPTQHRFLFYYVSLIFLIAMFFVVKRIVNSPTGRVIIATRENESRSRMIGYNPASYRTITFLCSGIIAGLAGGLYSIWNLSATPSMTSAVTTINALIMVILGGMGTLIGPIVGAGVMQALSLVLYDWFGSRWPLMFGLIFVAIVIFLPYGIVGTWRMQGANRKAGWERLMRFFKPGDEEEDPPEVA